MDPPRHLNSQGDSTRLMGEVEASHTPGGIRTPNPLIRSQMLYPVELPVLSGFSAFWCIAEGAMQICIQINLKTPKRPF